MVREIVHSIDGLLIYGDRLNDPISELLLDCTIILCQNVRVVS